VTVLASNGMAISTGNLEDVRAEDGAMTSVSVGGVSFLEVNVCHLNPCKSPCFDAYSDAGGGDRGRERRSDSREPLILGRRRRGYYIQVRSNAFDPFAGVTFS
jgi:hypothetical protein